MLLFPSFITSTSFTTIGFSSMSLIEILGTKAFVSSLSGVCCDFNKSFVLLIKSFNCFSFKLSLNDLNFSFKISSSLSDKFSFGERIT